MKTRHISWDCEPLTFFGKTMLQYFYLERLSFECRKTKTKVITLNNHNSHKQSNEPIRARSKYMSPAPSAGKRVRVKSRLVLVLLLIGRESGARFVNQSQSVAMHNQSNCGITFDTQLKSGLFTNSKSPRKRNQSNS